MTLAVRSLVTAAALVLAMPVAAALRPAQAAETALDRGTYLMRGIVACGNCHTPKDANGHPLADQELSGGVAIDAPVFHAVAPNITPDKATGIGNWTDAQIIDAIRNGKRPDGSTIGPPMAIPFYSRMSDSDARAIVAYLRAVKPIHHPVEKSSYKIPLPAAYGPRVTHVADTSRQNHLAYGRYLATIGHCLECHTPQLPSGQLDMRRLGAGGRELPAFPSGMTVSANLTPANPNGMAHWTNAQVETAITSGVRPDGRRLALLMAFDWYKTIDKADLDAVVAYLRTLPAATP
ncbi:MAG: c-type cytochrome [Acetobacteraceae bacterium]|jgi:mono/diheme cytochrome c family protein